MQAAEQWATEACRQTSSGRQRHAGRRAVGDRDMQWATHACRQAVGDRRAYDEVRYTGHERGGSPRAPERMEGSQKKGAHEAPARLTKIWPQRRDTVTHDYHTITDRYLLQALKTAAT